MDSNQPLDDIDFNSDLDLDKLPVNLLPVNKFILFSLLSLGLYAVWWMYKSWRFFKNKDGLNIMPAARALFAIFFTHALFERILKYAKQNGYQQTYSSTGLFVLFILLNFLGRLPEPYWLISLLSSFCLIQPLQALNYAIENSENYNGIYEDRLNTRQIFLVVVGGLFWLLIMVGLLMSV